MTLRHKFAAGFGFIITCQCSLALATDPEVLWSFTGMADGNQPRGDLLAVSFHAIYGTASSGGMNQNGTVFVIDPHTPGAKEKTIYNFTGGQDGSLPSAGLGSSTVVNRAGKAYPVVNI